jgi:prepilin-type N-terminal cleavage/methylation domain-containing protein
MKKQKGFTLVELMVAAGITVIVGAAIAGLQYIMTQNQVTVLTGSLNTDQANMSLAQMSKEIRTARAGDQGAYLFESTTPQSLVFYSDIDGDGQSERIRYFLQGTVLSKGIIDPVGTPPTYPSANEKIRIITENVRNGTTALFTYFDEDDQATNTVSLIRIVRIYLRVNQSATSAQNDYVLETSAHVRTLKENL